METACWISAYCRGDNGYVRIWAEGRTGYAHRVSYEYFVGPIPDGLQIDHLCRNRACINPDHLEAVTNRENAMRGESPGAKTARTNQCKRGHSMVDAYTFKNGSRTCRVCRRASINAWVKNNPPQK